MRLLLLAGLVVAMFLGGCAKAVDFSDTVVSAASPGEYARFRAELGTRFTAEQLKPLDTATQELQLDAMNRNIPTAAGRELDMLAVVNGKPVQAVLRLGWQARKARFLREIAEFDAMLARDLQQQAKTAATGTPESVTRRIGSEREVLAQLHQNLADTERRLAEMEQR